uniref:Uncharacterized protein n=1 Tax=Vespula pensylvanica TaxID=30213 RepID=A0A834P6W0_VESPE|nr:hypothetical protein H0235_006513 [Vespula pensylvanica]
MRRLDDFHPPFGDASNEQRPISTFRLDRSKIAVEDTFWVCGLPLNRPSATPRQRIKFASGFARGKPFSIYPSLLDTIPLAASCFDLFWILHVKALASAVGACTEPK